MHLELTRSGDLLGATDRPSLGRYKEAAALFREALAVADTLLAADPNDRVSRVDAGLEHIKLAEALVFVDPREALVQAGLGGELLDTNASHSAEFRALPRISAANAHRRLGEYPAAERRLREADRILNLPESNTQADLNLAWAQLERARGNREAAANWAARAVAAQERLYRKTSTPFYAWNLEQALQFADTADARRRLVEVWDEQNRRYPGHPYLEERLAAAKTALSIASRPTDSRAVPPAR